MDIRTELLVWLCSRRLGEPARRTVDYDAYQRWREEHLSASWRSFEQVEVAGRSVLDFGCGDGALSLFLATHKKPRQVVGVDLNGEAIARARAQLAAMQVPGNVSVEFRQGRVEGLPVDDASFDLLVAFDCLEHVMSPLPILKDWCRILRPGGRCLIEWYPYKGPWGPHMESLLPVPWAHVLFGQRAMFRAAERIYDLPQFTPRHWDLTPDGQKKPNKWRQWSSFREQGYINELTERQFRGLADQAGLRIARYEAHSFGGASWRRAVGRALMSLPLIGEYFVSHVIIELVKP